MSKFRKISNILLILTIFSIFLLNSYYYDERYFVYEKQNPYSYWNTSIQQYDSSIPPSKVCSYENLQYVCRWENVPTSKDDLYIYRINPLYGYFYKYQNMISLALITIFVFINISNIANLTTRLIDHASKEK